jgi:Ca-activated chloride channel family protein
VLRYNATKPRIPLVALYPSDGIHPNEVPLITVQADWVTDQQRAALDRFAVFLVTGEENKLFAADGWRTPVCRRRRIRHRAWWHPSRDSRRPANAGSHAPVAPSMDRSRPSGIRSCRARHAVSMNERVAAAGKRDPPRPAKQGHCGLVPRFSDRNQHRPLDLSRQENRADHTVVLNWGQPSRNVGGETAVQSQRKSLTALRADGATGLYDTVIAAARAAHNAWREGNKHHRPDPSTQERGPGDASSRSRCWPKLEPLAGPERQCGSSASLWAAKPMRSIAAPARTLPRVRPTSPARPRGSRQGVLGRPDGQK